VWVEIVIIARRNAVARLFRDEGLDANANKISAAQKTPASEEAGYSSPTDATRARVA
jgi:hypothetical protein